MTDSGSGTPWVRFPLDLPITLWRNDVAMSGVARELGLQRGDHGLTALTLTLSGGWTEELGEVEGVGESGEAGDGAAVTLAFKESLVGSLPTNAVALRRGLVRRGDLTDADNWSKLDP